MTPQVDSRLILERFNEIMEQNEVFDQADLAGKTGRVTVASVVDGKHMVAELV